MNLLILSYRISIGKDVCMSLLPRLSTLWRNLFDRDRVEQELAEELRTYLELLTDMKIKEGLKPEEARRAALIELGGMEQVKEKVREIRMGHYIETIWQDLRYGMRMLARSPVFTAVAVLSLALGIGANTALFSLVDEVLLKMLPVKKPGELVLFNWLSGPNRMVRGISGTIITDPATGLGGSGSFSYLTFERLRDHSTTLSDVFAFAPLDQVNVDMEGQAEIAGGQFVSGGYYAGLGAQAILGRTISEADDQAGASPVVVITHRYWKRRFGLDPKVIGKTINVNNVPFTIIGVTPPEFSGALQIGQSPDLSIPMAMEPRVSPDDHNLVQPWFWWLQIMGRLKPGVSDAQARASLEEIFQQSALEGWQALQARMQARGQEVSHEPRDVPALRISPGGQGLTELRRKYSQPLMVLMAVVGLVLLIACVNVANLLLARAATRQKEIAVRLAMGASRSRLIRQLLTESVLLAILGGALGILFAYWAKDMLLALRAWGGGALVLDLKLDIRVLGFTTAVCLITGILFGLAPALRATRIDLTPALKDGARTLSAGSCSLLSKGLIVMQVALSLLLLIGAGLFVGTLRNLQNVDVGFNRENLLLFKIDPELTGYKDAQIMNLYQQLVERIEAVPGVRSVTLSRHPLLSGRSRFGPISAQGYAPQSGEDDDVYANIVAPNFFETMEMPILLGRSLSPRDDQHAPKVAVINQTMARKYFGDENPIGRRFGFGGPETSGQIEVVGVARDAKYTDLRRETPPTFYVPYQQEAPGQMTFAVRAADDATALIASIRETVREADQKLPLSDVRTQSQQVNKSIAQERLFATLSGFFGLLALLLASIGLYGVMSYSVAHRTNEIGIRLALGAQRSDVIRLVLRETLLLVLMGLVIGLGAALASTRLISSMLFGLTPNDPGIILLAILLLIAVATLAGYLPARRASRVDPIVALRYE
jgi:predicted permease